MKISSWIKVLIISVLILYISVFFAKNTEKYVEKFKIKKENDCTNTEKIYYENENLLIFSYCLKNIKYKDDKNYIELDKYLSNNSLNSILNEKETWKEVIVYKDGGTKKYVGNNISIIKCNTIDGNKKIYITPSENSSVNFLCK